MASEPIAQPENKGVTQVYRSKGQLFTANLLGGVAWGFGTVMGATIVVALVLLLLKTLGGIPFIGSFINEITKSISETRL